MLVARISEILAVVCAAGASPVGLASSAELTPQDDCTLVKRELGLECPLRLERFSGIPDGGSLAGRFIGAGSDTCEFWWDGSARPPEMVKMPRNVYIGSEGTLDKGEKLGVGGTRELAFITALRLFADQHFTRAEQDSMRKDWAADDLGAERQRYSMSWMTNEEKAALRAEQLARKLESQRQAFGSQRR